MEEGFFKTFAMPIVTCLSGLALANAFYKAYKYRKDLESDDVQEHNRKKIERYRKNRKKRVKKLARNPPRRK